MKRRLVFIAGAAAAVGSVIGLVPASPAAADPVLVRVCLTLNERSIAVSVNGTPLIGETVVGQPRTCFGV